MSPVLTRPLTAMRSTALREWPWYPVLIAASIVLQPLADLPLQLGAGLRPLLIALAIGLLMTLAWVRILGRGRGGAAAAISLMALMGATDPVRALPFVGALAIIAIEAAWSARGTMRIQIPWARITSVLNVVLVVFVGLQVGKGVVLRHATAPLPVPANWVAASGSQRPDIFLILADGHGRRDVLAERYDYDMVALANALTEAGLVEASDSYANHSVTRYSLSVLLNGRPLSELGQDLAQPADDNVAYRALPRSSGIQMLEAAGYETTIVSSGYDHLPLREVDHYVDVGPRTELEAAIWAAAGVGRFARPS